MPLQTSTFHSAQGELFVSDTDRGRTLQGPALLLIHGNSFNQRIFKHLLTADLPYRVVAFDLLGHGRSGNAVEPLYSYTMPSYARTAFEVLQALGIYSVVVLGWSLGGHIAIEMVEMQYQPQRPCVVEGVMIIGTPPVNAGEIDKAFTLAKPGEAAEHEEPWRSAFAARDDLTEAEMEEYAHVCADEPYEDWMAEAVKRTDQRARSIMFGSFARSTTLHQRSIVEQEVQTTVAVVNGSAEPWINLDWVRSVSYSKLWRGDCVEMEGLFHAPFWAQPTEFLEILKEFMRDMAAYDSNRAEPVVVTAPAA
jgi:pimeloyl-ACP methyl ester carboxylesterase